MDRHYVIMRVRMATEYQSKAAAVSQTVKLVKLVAHLNPKGVDGRESGL